MSTYTTLKLRSTSTAVLSIKDLNQIPQAIQYANKQNLKVVPLGEGSNVVLPVFWDVLCLRIQLRGIEKIKETNDEVYIRVGAGENWHDLVKHCIEEEWFGLENLALIPGSCGAAPVQNIGAYGTDIIEFLTHVHLVDRQDGTSKIVRAEDCGLQYRTSYFKTSWKDKYIITAVDLKLSKSPEVNVSYTGLQGLENPLDLFNKVCSLRRAKLPSIEEFGSVGSFFQNPTVSTDQFNEIVATHPSVKGYEISPSQTRIAAASLIEICDWKGFRMGDVGVYEKHALCIVNYGHSDQSMILELAEKMRADVREKFSITLEIEPRVYT